MSFWTKFKGFLKRNANKNFKTISINTGSIIIAWAISGFAALIGLLTGNPMAWITALIAGIGASEHYVISLVRSIFGNKEKEEEPV